MIICMNDALNASNLKTVLFYYRKTFSLINY